MQLNLRPIYEAQTTLGEHFADINRTIDMDGELESNDADYWLLANWMSKKQFVFVGQLRNGDNQTQREARAYAKYVIMRMMKADLIDDDGNATQQQGYEIYCLVTYFYALLSAITRIHVGALE